LRNISEQGNWHSDGAEHTVSQQTQHGQVAGQTRSSEENSRRNGFLLRELEDLVNLVRKSIALERLSIESGNGLECVKLFLGGLSKAGMKFCATVFSERLTLDMSPSASCVWLDNFRRYRP
jgi:hypothetical protein